LCHWLIVWNIKMLPILSLVVISACIACQIWFFQNLLLIKCLSLADFVWYNTMLLTLRLVDCLPYKNCWDLVNNWMYVIGWLCVVLNNAFDNKTWVESMLYKNAIDCVIGWLFAISKCYQSCHWSIVCIDCLSYLCNYCLLYHIFLEID
jgi:hypothetical protein